MKLTFKVRFPSLDPRWHYSTVEVREDLTVRDLFTLGRAENGLSQQSPITLSVNGTMLQQDDTRCLLDAHIIAFDIIEMEILTAKELPAPMKKTFHSCPESAEKNQHNRRCIWQLAKELELFQFLPLPVLGESKSSSKRASPSF